MIDRGEVLTIAGERDLRVDIIEKDYVLGWMLAGIFAHPILEVWPKSGRKGLYSWQSMMGESGHAGRAI